MLPDLEHAVSLVYVVNRYRIELVQRELAVNPQTPERPVLLQVLVKVYGFTAWSTGALLADSPPAIKSPKLTSRA